MSFSLSFSHTHTHTYSLVLYLQRNVFARMGESVWTSMGLVNALQATQGSTVSLVSMIHLILSGKKSFDECKKKKSHCKTIN